MSSRKDRERVKIALIECGDMLISRNTSSDGQKYKGWSLLRAIPDRITKSTMSVSAMFWGTGPYSNVTHSEVITLKECDSVIVIEKKTNYFLCLSGITAIMISETAAVHGFEHVKK